MKLFEASSTGTALAYMLLTLAAVFFVGGIGWAVGGLVPEAVRPAEL